MRKNRSKWKQVDWLLPDEVIAEQMGIVPERVRSARSHHAPLPLRKEKSRRLAAIANAIDWRGCSNSDVSRVVGVSTATASRLRNIIDPGSCDYPAKTKLGMIVWEALDWSRSDGDLSRLIGTSEQTVSKQRKRVSNLPKGNRSKGSARRYDWSKVDFETMSNNEIMRILDCSHISVRKKRAKLSHRFS